METAFQLNSCSSVTDDHSSEEKQEGDCNRQKRHIGIVFNIHEIENHRDKAENYHQNLPHNVALPVPVVVDHAENYEAINKQYACRQNVINRPAPITYNNIHGYGIHYNNESEENDFASVSRFAQNCVTQYDINKKQCCYRDYTPEKRRICEKVDTQKDYTGYDSTEKINAAREQETTHFELCVGVHILKGVCLFQNGLAKRAAFGNIQNFDFAVFTFSHSSHRCFLFPHSDHRQQDDGKILAERMCP